VPNYDPWGPISAALYEWNDAEFVENAVRYTGVQVEWPEPTQATGYSHKTRIRSYKRAIDEAHNALDDQGKGQFARTIAQVLYHELTNQGRNYLAEKVVTNLSIGLTNIGWEIDGNGTLSTQNSTLSEQFFPPGTPFDAYVAIKDILATATRSILVVDGYIGGTLFNTFAALPACAPSIRLLTNESNLKRDFDQEANAFRTQFAHIAVDVRTAKDFHDRFIVIDDTLVYHIGASVKDAGKRAFVISRLEDRPIVESVLRHIHSSWDSAQTR
jgi:hypothetical protein